MRRVASCVLALSAACWVAPSPAILAASDSATEVVTLTGEVEAVDENEEGVVTSVAVFDPDYGSVLIDSAGKGRQLLDLVDSTVRVHGTIEELDEESGFLFLMHVTGFEELDPSESEEDEGWSEKAAQEPEA